jgi:predicted NBD/HSP70 family sugar kinase
MIAGGIDLGGTKIEAQVFDQDWGLADRRRIATPAGYDALVAAMAGQIAWLAERAGRTDLPIGISAAGMVSAETGLALTANLAATGRPFPADIRQASGRTVTYVNDCRAFTLSETKFGAGRGRSPVAGLILGTGIGGGVAVNGALLPGLTGVGGEFGHMPAPAFLIEKHALPVVPCGCGRSGCFETLVAGPGLGRIARVLTGRELAPPDIARGRARDPGLALVWSVWCEIAAELIATLCFTIDPEVVVLGGGLSRIEGVAADLARALRATQYDGFATPAILVAEAGDASGARGAAWAAWQEAGHG